MGFSFPRAALGLTVFLSLSLGWISFQYYKQQSELVLFFEQEAIGINTAKELTVELLTLSTSSSVSRDHAEKVIQLLQQDRVMSLIGRRDLKAEVRILAKAISNKEPGPLSMTDVHKITRLLKNILRSVIEQTNLILDPSFHTYYFVDALFSQFPDVIYQDYSWQELLEFRETKNYKALYGEIGARRAAFANYQESLRKAITEDSEYIDELESPLSVRDLTEQTLPLFNLILSPNKIDLVAFNMLLNHWRDQSEKVLQSESQVFASLNQKRLSRTANSLTISLIVFFLSWFISLAFLIFIVRSFLLSRSVLQKVITAQRDALSKATKLATLGEMSASIGHEITNPLAVIRATTDLLEKNFGAAQPKIHTHVERIRRMALRIEEIINNMKSFLHSDNEDIAEGKPVDIVRVLEEVSEDFQPRLSAMNAHLSIEKPSDKSLLVLGKYSELLQVFSNLINNAMDAIKDQPQKEIVVRVHASEAFAEIEVQDSGPGVPPENRKHIFDALFTTKATGEGTGLGLSIAQRIVSRYQGRLRLTEKGPGACFEVVLNRYLKSS